jgi:hypothetical protein
MSTPRATLRLLLSDVSQSQGTELSFGDATTVVLNQVVRSTQRIVEGARAFQTNDSDEPTKGHHAAHGLPLKPFLVRAAGNAAARIELNAATVLQAVQSLLRDFPGLELHDCLAIIVPNSDFVERFTPALKANLANLEPKFKLVNAAEANQIMPVADSGKAKRLEQSLVLDTVDNFNGLERLIVIAVDLDSPIGKDASRTRSQLYRAITRAQMIVIVVNEVKRGGWLEFLTRVEFDDEKDFDMEEEAKRSVKGGARNILAKALEEKELQAQQEQPEQQEQQQQQEEEEAFLAKAPPLKAFLSELFGSAGAAAVAADKTRGREGEEQKREKYGNWEPDDSAKFCQMVSEDGKQCKNPFTLFNRRHHCRECGKLICGRKTCLASELKLVEYIDGSGGAKKKKKKICTICFQKDADAVDSAKQQEEEEVEEEEEEKDAKEEGGVNLRSAVWDTSANVNANIASRSIEEMRRDGFMPLKVRSRTVFVACGRSV